MPLYEYSCPVCGSAFEALRKIAISVPTVAGPSPRVQTVNRR